MNAVVTGAFGYTGRHIASRLLDRGDEVRTLTNDQPSADPFGGRVMASPLVFDRRTLVAALHGADVLFNTYWVRFERGGMTFDDAVRNSYTLIDAAREAGVRRIVHVSITNPFVDPTLPYFRGKAAVEGAVMASGLPYGIVRPTVVFGGNDVFVNNIAWLLRRFPFFLVPGRGNYRLQPVSVFDVARLCVEVADRTESSVIDAAGPEIFAFRGFVRTIRDAVRSRSVILTSPPRVALLASRLAGLVVRDRVITRDEVAGLRRELIVSRHRPTGHVAFSEWVKAQADLGRHYVSEVARNYRREPIDRRLVHAEH